MNAKHQAMQERLRLQEEARQEKKLAAVSHGAEAAQTFVADFESLHSALSRDISHAEQACATPNGGADAKSLVVALTERLASLQVAFNNNAALLANYDAKKTQESIDALETRLQACKARVAPRKRFAFRAKVNKTSERATSKENENRNGAPAIESTTEQSSTISSNSNVLHVHDRVGELIERSQSELDVNECTLERLSQCTVWLPVTLAAVRLHGLRNCRVLCGAVDGALYVQDCHNCVVVGAVGQARIHESAHSTFYLLARSRIVIEHCTALGFGPLCDFDGRDALLAAFPVTERDAWRDVQDFGWIKTQQSPNWTLVAAREPLRRDEPASPSTADQSAATTDNVATTASP